MDRALDEVISERQREPPRAPRDRRPNNYPRDGIRKLSQRDDSRNLDRDWVHDKFEDDVDQRRPARGARNKRLDRYFPDYAHLNEVGAKLRVDNIHYELTEDDIRELFFRIGPVKRVQLLYDRQDRSQGTAYVTYESFSDAKIAIREFDGANANGQPIRLSLMPLAPSKPTRNPFDNVVKPPRSLFDRIGIEERDTPSSREGRAAGGRGRRGRSDSPIRHSDVSKPAPEGIDRYIPGQGSRQRSRASRSPIRRRGTPRDGGRRPGAHREDSGRRGGRGGDGGRLVNGRPRKTAQELDAEMEDYWGSRDAAGGGAAGNAPVAHNGAANGTTAGATETPMTAATTTLDDDIDMIE
ncbi:hypothetical protein BJ546DRAFT_294271 [Cryomyces antarcticus]